MSEDFEEGAFLGLPRGDGPADVAVVPLAYELTTSYGTGACDGPQACVEASAQVELYDDRLGDDLPAGLVISTEPVWEGTAPTLRAQLDELAAHAASFYNGDLFPLFLGGEHGILPPIMHAARHHPSVNGDLSTLTVVQLDAHADLRSSLDDEAFSHACAASRSLDVGVGRLLQAGIRAYSLEEAERIQSDERITTFFARDTQHPHTGGAAWQAWLDQLSSLTGPVHFTLDIDGLDGALVPATGTPVPGGLSYWQAVETIETLFANPNVVVISADVNEIVAQHDTPLTQFTAAGLATKIVASHVLARREGRWTASSMSSPLPPDEAYFQRFEPSVPSAP
ncbi:MAG: arginase family protein [Candidatus Thermoplasmatota archaeon]|nr:arginase family protein [Candidatus Thermoplasmatota archaeon]MEC8681201.1 arginase family protein [Candidatus Thermoplasmatota archaeon]